MSDETWLIGHKVDASKKIFVVTEILLFDFELFIGDRRQKVKYCAAKACSQHYNVR